MKLLKAGDPCPCCGLSILVTAQTLYNLHSGKQSRTFWECYMKLEGLKDGL